MENIWSREIPRIEKRVTDSSKPGFDTTRSHPSSNTPRPMFMPHKQPSPSDTVRYKHPACGLITWGKHTGIHLRCAAVTLGGICHQRVVSGVCGVAGAHMKLKHPHLPQRVCKKGILQCQERGCLLVAHTGGGVDSWEYVNYACELWAYAYLEFFEIVIKRSIGICRFLLTADECLAVSFICHIPNTDPECIALWLPFN